MDKLYIICHTYKDMEMTIETFYSNHKAVKYISEQVSDEYKVKAYLDQDVEEYLAQFSEWSREENDNMCKNVVEIKIISTPPLNPMHNAKKMLKEFGYYTDMLWHIDDVKRKFNCTDKEAYIVLHGALNNEATLDKVWFAIGHHAEAGGFQIK